MSTISEENKSNDIIDNHALFVDRTHAATLLAEKLKVLINNTGLLLAWQCLIRSSLKEMIQIKEKALYCLL